MEEFRVEAARLRATRKRGAPRSCKETSRWVVAYEKRTGVSINKVDMQLGVGDAAQPDAFTA